MQSHTIELLTWCGYEVYQTTHRYRLQTCPKCAGRFMPTGGYGSRPGVPDLIVYHPRWPPGAVWIGVEMKGQKTPLSDEQKALAGAGRIIVARSDREALDGIQAAEERLFGRVHGSRPVGW